MARAVARPKAKRPVPDTPLEAEVRRLQARLAALGLEPGPVDGDIGPLTLKAVHRALDALKPEAAERAEAAAAVPASWMPDARMKRIVVHWTAGGHKPNAPELAAYHILIGGDGTLHRGDRSIRDNEEPIDRSKPYAAHVKNANGGSIGVSLCGMLGAREVPFTAGPQPITARQWERLTVVLRDLCRRYAIPVTPSTVLTHAEVQGTLGIAQERKWDIKVLPWDPSVTNAREAGDLMRAAVLAAT